MDKDQIVAKLTEMGYKAVLDGNVIMCTINSQKAVRGLKNTLRGLFYSGSWGYRIKSREEPKEPAEQIGGQMSIMDLLE